MRANSIIELSHKIIPGKENFRFESQVDDVTKYFPEIHHPSDVWYVIGEFTMSTHLGTHIEFPYHHLKEGLDAMDYPIENLIGEAIVLDFTNKSNNEPITIAELKNYAGRMKKGDIIFFQTGMDKYYRTEKWRETPYLSIDAALWLIEEFHPKVIGSDAWDIEDPNFDIQPVHTNLFKNNIAMIESATNLSAIGNDRVNVVILPLAIKGIDACPVRIIAFPKSSEF
jgi:arylformamidase